MVLWRNRNIEDLTANELRFALEDAVLEIEKSARPAESSSFFQAYVWGFATASLVAITATGFVAMIA